MNRRPFQVFESPAERRGRLASEEPGEMVFSDQLGYVEAMRGRIRNSDQKYKKIAETGEMSSSTVSNMASGKTRLPRFSTMFGLAASLGLEVTFRPRGRR